MLALDRPASDILDEKGRAGLDELPGVGASLVYTIESLIRTGEFHTLRPAGGHIDPERLLTSLPGVGPHLARTLHERLGVSTLEQLERAAYDGRLARRRASARNGCAVSSTPWRDGWRGRGCRSRSTANRRSMRLLAVDAEYRRQADENTLPTLTPRRFNPENEPWLPLYNTDRGGWRFRALFSNTALAHRLNRTRDWVVISFHDGFTSGQRTVVTETLGDLRGRRVVRGRERECRAYYASVRTTIVSGGTWRDRVYQIAARL